MNNIIRQIVLDTETTGMNIHPPYYIGHKIIEIGIVEIINRQITGKFFHTYLNPMQSISFDAYNIHGISNEFLLDKPVFCNIITNFINYIKGSQLIIHNAQFDIDFLNYEISLINNDLPKIQDICSIIDTLKIARELFPGKRNSLNSLCSRFNVDKQQRTTHGALLDAKLLANVFLAMTSSQNTFKLDDFQHINLNQQKYIKNKMIKHQKLLIIKPSTEENKLHIKQINMIKNKCGFCLWN
ncbi:DNA polymerase III subunit epsilon [Enterobacteriaceae endosymbiont of Neohaemonia nigricornis]|uniref:DNA polymerase III subunit epsilon n=1 Tax=Enterobacteriaceae endosymbiont of Neohaemonia nigricornis TaxID=2675792 RepID=UPI00144A021E|nr:DNA polymerase III subunit epsilon [Enterobacteriaceae endosymbiont of Neohaemonia nigricornis]QJC30329.1 DNA polymerase III subunit epsilon [Enterobacteriaceae endosymbiont of Neohaemonia nigricornis]